ncbi:hypothetical protein SLEP1_g59132 [Rubroshorea leprosula]|uniref:Uncharacterized protein n=1 Tax=Rubroshorea leprosula TaxID=152421 RepID=A0AAV5MRI5_9ROSI|nr:hypothetical protein SLEP1_g59132 [Rubroshorea leprosula]
MKVSRTQQERLKRIRNILMGDCHISYGMLVGMDHVLMQQSLA